MKTLTYSYESMVKAAKLLDSLVVMGTQNFRALSELANILDSGTIGEIREQHKDSSGKNTREVMSDGIPTVLPSDRLAKLSNTENTDKPDKPAPCGKRNQGS